MTKKLLSIFLAVFVALSFSACENEKSSNSSTAEMTTTSNETTLEETTVSEAPVEKFEWNTIDDLSDELYLDGVQVKVPGTLEDLGEDFSISYDTRLWGEYMLGDNKVLHTSLFYKGKEIGSIGYYNYNDDYTKINEQTPYNMIHINVNLYEGDISFCNVSKPFTMTKIKQTLGDPDKNGGFICEYYDKIDQHSESSDDVVKIWYDMEDKNTIYFIYILKI
ncbi:MAG TPA: hypothetical protein PKI60_04030 [Oscillospiraceae bacterium]|nr:hypothetical protein [Oscillospiraceae bacterium]